VVDTVYLANMFCELETGGVTFDQLEPSVLENFGITTKKQVENLLDKFLSGFKKEASQ